MNTLYIWEFMLIKLIFKNFYPDRLCLDSRLNHFYIVKDYICNACLLSFSSREICYDIFIVVVNKNLTKPGNIKQHITRQKMDLASA